MRIAPATDAALTSKSSNSQLRHRASIRRKKSPRRNARGSPWFTNHRQYIRGRRSSRTLSDGLQIAGRNLAALAVSDLVVGQLVAFIQRAHSGPLDSRDMDKNVLAAVIGLNETVAFFAVEPFHCSRIHGSILQSVVN